MPAEKPHTTQEIAVLGGGCFWCTEAVLSGLRGVAQVEPGYCGGHIVQPTYAQVCQGDSGHVEVVRVTFDPQTLGFDDLLAVFFATHDPTTLNRQGADVGPQYASVVFYQSPAQHKAAQACMAAVQEALGRKVVTQLRAAHPFWPAEAGHHRYWQRHPQQPYCQFVIAPKLAELHKRFKHFIAPRPLESPAIP